MCWLFAPKPFQLVQSNYVAHPVNRFTVLVFCKRRVDPNLWFGTDTLRVLHIWCWYHQAPTWVIITHHRQYCSIRSLALMRHMATYHTYQFNMPGAYWPKYVMRSNGCVEIHTSAHLLTIAASINSEHLSVIRRFPILPCGTPSFCWTRMTSQ